jgi:hypothetical protein
LMTILTPKRDADSGANPAYSTHCNTLLIWICLGGS